MTKSPSRCFGKPSESPEMSEVVFTYSMVLTKQNRKADSALLFRKPKECYLDLLEATRLILQMRRPLTDPGGHQKQFPAN